MSQIFRVSHIPVAAHRVGLERRTEGESAKGTSYIEGATGFTWVDHDVAGRTGKHWDSMDFSNAEIIVCGAAHTFYFDIQDPLDAGWFKLTLYARDAVAAAAHLNLDQEGWGANTKHVYIACEFDRVVDGMKLKIRTSARNAPGPAGANGYAIVGLKVSEHACPADIKIQP